MSEKMMSVFAQEFNKNVPQHEYTLEGTKKFPIYQIGFSNYNGVSPIHLETYSFGQNEDGSYSSTFAHILQNPENRNKYYSLLFFPHHEDNINAPRLLRKCKFIREVEKEKIYPNMDDIKSYMLELGILEPREFVLRPIEIVFDMYWKVYDET